MSLRVGTRLYPVGMAGMVAGIGSGAWSLVQAIVPLWGARSNDATLMDVAGSTALAQFVFAAASFAALTAAYVGSDFSVMNVLLVDSP